MSTTSKRLQFLEKATAAGADAFAWYGLAMEYRSLGRHAEALATFEALKAKAPDYVPMYLMCAQLLETMGRPGDARSWLEAGIAPAQVRGDEHALSELRSALAALA